MTKRHLGIAGLKGREPVGAVVSIGVKGPRGAPIEKDRLHILEPSAGPDDRRAHHPRFARFNAAPAEHRRSLMCQLVHAERSQCFEHQYRCQSAKGQPSHPGRAPFCTGNGERATRYVGSDDAGHHFEEIPCPAERCEFRVGDRAACKPWMRLLFRVTWNTPDLPTLLVKYTSGGWNTIRNCVGFFDQVEAQGLALGLTQPNLMGLRFTMQLSEKTSKVRKSRFPVVTLVPLDDPIAFFVNQIERIAHADHRRAQVLEHDPDVVDADYLAHTTRGDS